MKKRILLAIGLLVSLLMFSSILISGTKFDELRKEAVLTSEQRLNTIQRGEIGIIILYKSSCPNCKKQGGVIAEILDSRAFSLKNDVSYLEVSNGIPSFLELQEQELQTPYILVFGKDKQDKLKYFYQGPLVTVEEQKDFIAAIDENFLEFVEKLN